MPTVAKTYTPLIELAPKVLIGRCSQVLPNRLQCWKAGDYLVKEGEGDSARSYQLCSMHVVIQQRADALVAQEESSGRPQPEDSDPKSIHSKMMQAEQKIKQVFMPSGEKTAQR